MSCFAKRLMQLKGIVATEAFKILCRFKNPMHFTRNRKMTLAILVMTVLFRKGRSLKVELKDFATKCKSPILSKVAYHKQRMKLNPLCYYELLRYYARLFYRNSSNVKTLKEHLILACDGGDLNVPSTPENIEIFHNSSKRKGRPRPQAGISCLFDILNRQICDAIITEGKISERSSALLHIKKLRNNRHTQGYIFI